MAKKIWPWLVFGFTPMIVIGGIMVVGAFRRVDSNLHTYMTDKEYAEAVVLPADSMIVMVAYAPGNPMAANVRSEVEAAAAANPEVHYIILSREIGERVGMEVDGVWGRVDSAYEDATYTGGFGPQTTADEIGAHVKAASAAVLAARASGSAPDEPDTDDDTTNAEPLATLAGDEVPATAFDPNP